MFAVVVELGVVVLEAEGCELLPISSKLREGEVCDNESCGGFKGATDVAHAFATSALQCGAKVGRGRCGEQHGQSIQREPS